MDKTLLENFFGQDFCFKRVAPPETKHLTKCFDSNKAVGINTIPPKLITNATDFFNSASHCCNE